MKVEIGPGPLDLQVSGDFTGAAEALVGPALRQLLEAASGADGHVVLDLTGVGYMDSAGFSAWIRLERVAQQAGRELKVRGARPLIQDLFRFADLEEVLVPAS